MEKNDEEFLEELFTQNYTGLVELAYGKLKGQYSGINASSKMERAEEIAQDVFLTAYQNMASLRSSSNPTGWLFNTMRNKLRHELRSRQVVVEYYSNEFLDSFEYRDPEDLSESRLAQVLTAEELEMARQVYLDGRSTGEVAELHGLTPAACRKKLSRIRKKLEKFFD